MSKQKVQKTYEEINARIKAGEAVVVTAEEMVELFDLKDVNRKASTFNTDKLDWLTQHYLKTLPATAVARQ